MALIGTAQLDAFAGRMDELSQRATSVLQSYLDDSQNLHASQGFTGDGGVANLKLSADVHEAQARIQARFQNLNDTIRQQNQGYSAKDADNAHTIASVAGSLRYL